MSACPEGIPNLAVGMPILFSTVEHFDLLALMCVKFLVESCIQFRSLVGHGISGLQAVCDWRRGLALGRHSVDSCKW